MSPDNAIEYEIGDGAMTFLATGHHYLIGKAPFRKQKLQLTDASGVLLHVDKVDIVSELARKRFIKDAGEALNGAADEVRRELKVIAANLDRLLPDQGRSAVSLADSNVYTVNDAGIYYERYVPNLPEPIETQVANFGARIIQDIEINDGTEDRREYRLEAWQGATRRTIAVSADRFETLRWAADSLGANAVVFPGPNAIGHIVAAIKLSSEPERRSVFGHTGWRELDDGTMGYLTASGAITGEGLRSDVGVSLSAPLDQYLFPEPPEGDDLAYSTARWLELIDVADRATTIPLFCALLRSVLSPADFSLFLKGATGQGKSQLAGLVQSSFGPALSAENLPANFSSTANALELLANLAKDAILVVDDFQRNPSANVDAVAERVGRATGNQSGRARLTRESALKHGRAPRGLVVMTGEDSPRGESLRTRMSIVELRRDSMRWDRLTDAQAAAKQGYYAAALAAFVRWIAAGYDAVQATFRERFELCRDEFQRGGQDAHHRTTQTAAQLMAAWTIFVDFAEATGAVEPVRLEALGDDVEQVLRELIAAQAGHQEAVDPVRQFIGVLESAIVSGQAHLCNQLGKAPVSADAWGWREIWVGNEKDWRASGRQIGWVAERGVYLDFGAAYLLVREQLARSGELYPLTEATLIKRLDETGHLLSRDERRETFRVRKVLQGQRRNVIHLAFPPDIATQAPLLDEGGS